MYGLIYKAAKDKGIITAIECLTCHKISYHPDDIKNRYCANCSEFHLEKQAAKWTCENPEFFNEKSYNINRSADFQLWQSSSSKSNKIHYSINGKNGLCMAGVSRPSHNPQPWLICVNCKKLKERGIAR